MDGYESECNTQVTIYYVHVYYYVLCIEVYSNIYIMFTCYGYESECKLFCIYKRPPLSWINNYMYIHVYTQFVF